VGVNQSLDVSFKIGIFRLRELSGRDVVGTGQEVGVLPIFIPSRVHSIVERSGKKKKWDHQKNPMHVLAMPNKSSIGKEISFRIYLISKLRLPK
jgi:hypothetical protein